MLNLPILKSTISAVITASVSKFYSNHNNKDSVMSGAVNFASVAITDALFSLSSMLPSWFSFLGMYAQDVASALVNVGIIWVLPKYSSFNPVSQGSMLADFLVSFGSAIVASYAVVPVRNILPGQLASLV